MKSPLRVLGKKNNEHIESKEYLLQASPHKVQEVCIACLDGLWEFFRSNSAFLALTVGDTPWVALRVWGKGVRLVKMLLYKL